MPKRAARTATGYARKCCIGAGSGCVFCAIAGFDRRLGELGAHAQTQRSARSSRARSLAATLLFRGLSFWLPMLPGIWFSKRALRVAERPPESTIRASW